MSYSAYIWQEIGNKIYRRIDLLSVSTTLSARAYSLNNAAARNRKEDETDRVISADDRYAAESWL